MPAVLHWWRGAVSYDEYWSMPHDHLERLIRYQREWNTTHGSR